jgi:virulence-associated protein VapD
LKKEPARGWHLFFKALKTIELTKKLINPMKKRYQGTVYIQQRMVKAANLPEQVLYTETFRFKAFAWFCCCIEYSSVRSLVLKGLIDVRLEIKPI